MRSHLAMGLPVLVIAAVLGAASPAHAWTRTVVHSARATVEVEREATLYVLLRLDVEVHAGWLHELELVDLGPEVELDRYRPPYFRSEEGEVFRPEAELHEDGRIRLWFPRREAPRRGVYRVYMRYRTKADAAPIEAGGNSRVRVVWSVPTWETGLHDVSVELRAPKGTRVPEELHESSPGIDHKVLERPGRTVVRWRRIHLPRMTEWPLTLDAPAGSIVVPIADEQAPPPDGFQPLPSSGERPIVWTLIALAVLALLKRRMISGTLGQNRVLIPLPWPAAIAGSVAIVGAAQWLAPTSLAWGLPLVSLALHRPITRATSLRALVFLDATNPIGALVWLCASAALLLAGQPTGALLLLPVFFSGTRQHVPPTNAESAKRLRSFAAELRVPDDAPPLCLAWRQDADGLPSLDVHLLTTRSGLRSVAFVVASSTAGLVRRREVMLAVRARAQSDADDLLRRRIHAGDDFRDPDGSILRLVPWDDDAVALLRVLARKAPKPVKASRGTWLLRELSDDGRKAA
jgi:hypothetical protein